MSIFDKKTLSPVFETSDQRLFHLTGVNFVESENGVQIVENVPSTFSDLVYAMNHFNISENEVVLNYDFTAKDHRYMPIKEGFQTQIDSVRTTVSPDFLNEQIDFLKNEMANLTLNEDGGSEVRDEINTELVLLEAELRASKSLPTYVQFRYVRESNAFQAESWKYDKHTHKYYINTSEILSENFVDHVFATGLVRHEHKHILEKFETTVRHLDLFEEVKNARVFEKDSIKVSVIRHLDRVFVYRINEETKIVKFDEMDVASAKKYVFEQTGSDLSDLVQDIIEEKVKKQIEIENLIDQLKEMSSFLKDQKGDLAEHDRNIPAIKEADAFLTNEIKELSDLISVLENTDLDRNEGYVRGKVNSDPSEYVASDSELEIGSIVSVDAMQYASSGKEDILTVFINSKPERLPKQIITLSSSEVV